MEGLRKREEELLEAVAAAEQKLSDAQEQRTELEASHAAATAGVAEREADLARSEARLEASRAAVAEREQQIQGLESQLNDAQTQKDAVAAEFKAREQQQAGSNDETLNQLKRDIAAQREAREAAEAKAADLRDELEETKAGLATRNDELQKRVAERDEQISALRVALDSEGDERVERSELNARIEALEAERERAQARAADLELELNKVAGGSGRAGSLAEELKRVQAERDEVSDKIRGLEGDNAELKGKLGSQPICT